MRGLVVENPSTHSGLEGPCAQCATECATPNQRKEEAGAEQLFHVLTQLIRFATLLAAPA